MRYVLRQKIWSFGKDFTIKDETGADRFRVDGKVFTIGNKLSFQDMQGNELAFIQQRLLSLASKYELHRNGQLAAVVKKELFTLFRCHFVIDEPGPNDIEAKGSFLDHEYTFYRGKNVVGAVSKKWFSWTDTYGVEINEGQDVVLLLASAVVIDLCCHDHKDRD